MMQIIQKWKIRFEFHSVGQNVDIFISDNIYSNMLRKLNEVSFDNEPDIIYIEKVKYPQP